MAWLPIKRIRLSQGRKGGENQQSGDQVSQDSGSPPTNNSAPPGGGAG
jgi:hypothetical protein